MPYTEQHKRQTRERIVEAARRLFNKRGFSDVSIDEIMSAAGLTRGGFYNHFKTKDELYAETLNAFTCTNPTENWGEAEVDFNKHGVELARQMVTGYVSQHHLSDIENQCPLIALPSDVARAGPAARAAYGKVFRSMAGIFEANAPDMPNVSARQQGLAIAAACVGAMILARTVDDPSLAEDVCESAKALIFDVTNWDQELAETA
jgi:TetR/AcrR family transcriptional regulator, transcriptional repressor for nem operon